LTPVPFCDILAKIPISKTKVCLLPPCFMTSQGVFYE
jgi:hypothetical protein